MSKTLAPSHAVTTRDPKGLKFVSIVEAAYNKADLSEEEAQRVNDAPGLSDAVRCFIETHRDIDRAYPADGVEFELTLDFGAPEADPIQMLRADGYDPSGWKFTGRNMSGVQTRAFQLVRVGACRNIDEVRQKLAEHGPVPEGQWRQAFKAAFPTPDGNGHIGFADPSWVHPHGYVSFPYVNSAGGSGFRWADDEHGEIWRWLVPASK